jgi:hypothetical protein
MKHLIFGEDNQQQQQKQHQQSQQQPEHHHQQQLQQQQQLCQHCQQQNWRQQQHWRIWFDQQQQQHAETTAKFEAQIADLQQTLHQMQQERDAAIVTAAVTESTDSQTLTQVEAMDTDDIVWSVIFCLVALALLFPLESCS